MPSKFDPQRHHRRSIRLKGYDYASAGGYFITIVTYQRECLFGEIVNDEMVLSDYGKVAEECWRAIPDHFPNVELGAYVVMPNHVHGIIIKNVSVGAQHAAPLRNTNVTPNSIGAIVRSFKSAVTKRIHEINHLSGTTIWQRNYYEHVIRDADDHNRIHLYIESNPSMWETDTENPATINK